jgi:hypothetical protein
MRPQDAKPQHVRIEFGDAPFRTRVWVDDEEWRASVKRVAIDVDSGLNIVTLAFYAKVTLEGDVPLVPWPVTVDVKPR